MNRCLITILVCIACVYWECLTSNISIHPVHDGTVPLPAYPRREPPQGRDDGGLRPVLRSTSLEAQPSAVVLSHRTPRSWRQRGRWQQVRKGIIFRFRVFFRFHVLFSKKNAKHLAKVKWLYKNYSFRVHVRFTSLAYELSCVLIWSC